MKKKLSKILIIFAFLVTGILGLGFFAPKEVNAAACYQCKCTVAQCPDKNGVPQACSEECAIFSVDAPSKCNRDSCWKHGWCDSQGRTSNDIGVYPANDYSRACGSSCDEKCVNGGYCAFGQINCVPPPPACDKQWYCCLGGTKAEPGNPIADWGRYCLDCLMGQMAGQIDFIRNGIVVNGQLQGGGNAACWSQQALNYLCSGKFDGPNAELCAKLQNTGGACNSVCGGVATSTPPANCPGVVAAQLNTPTITGNNVTFSWTLGWTPGQNARAEYINVSNSNATNADGTLQNSNIVNDVATNKTSYTRTNMPNGTYYWNIVSDGCAPVQRKTSPVQSFTVGSSGSTKPVSYKIAESLADLPSAPWQDYTEAQITYNLKDTALGVKTVFVEFKDSAGNTIGCSGTTSNPIPCQAQIELVSSGSTQVPGDADDNRCVDNYDRLQWVKERGGDCHRCTNWSNTQAPSRNWTLDYTIWYNAFIQNLFGPGCSTPPVNNCTTRAC